MHTLWFRRFNRLASGMVALMLLAGLWLSFAPPAQAAGPEEDMQRINVSVENALKAARDNKIALTRQEYKAYENAWLEIETSVLGKSRDAYRQIETDMQAVSDALAKKPAVQSEVVAALEKLYQTNQNFIAGKFAASSGSNSGVGVNTLLGQLDSARQFISNGNYDGAAREIKTFQEVWLDVEGKVKTRSASDYVATENDMALAYKLATEKSPEMRVVIDRMYNRLEPYLNVGNYGIFDAAIIILREGLEALLVVAALLTFLKKSGNASKQKWIWGGAVAGLGLSIAGGVAIQLLFSSAINGSNREIIEGGVGLFAAVMLFYVSYWMHSKSSVGAWQKYIRQKSTAALATGSLFGLALLSFLAIFREGAETVLFYLGIGPSINIADLLIGLGIGSGVLIVLGVLMLVVGVKLPIRPFFMVASVLVFFLCFKFIGTGIHALQVANILPSSSADYLPSQDFFGLFPTWETTIAQLIVLAGGIGFVVYNNLKNRRDKISTPPATKTSEPAAAR